MYKAKSNWLPLDLAGPVNKMLADFYLIKAFNADGDTKLQYFCLSKALDFMYEQADLDMLASWYLEHEGKACIMEKVLELEVPTELHYSVLKKVFKSASLKHAERDKISQIVFKGNVTDSIIRV
jgi:hypothetical protein